MKGADSSEMLPGQLGNCSDLAALAHFGCVASGLGPLEGNVSSWALRGVLFLEQGGS